MANSKFMRAIKTAALFVGGFLSFGCSNTDILDALVPNTGYTSYKSIAYGEHVRQKLDIYVPKNNSKPAPVVMFFYGGSWKKGSKDEYRFIGQAFASKGYVTVVADYRLYPEFFYPTFMQDSASAFVWVHKHISEYGGDNSKLFLAGHSAGAYNAVMLTVNDRFIKEAGGHRKWIKGTIGIAGPYDFLPMTDPDVIGVFSKEKDTLTQPVTFVAANTPPILLLTGDGDEDVIPRNSIRLNEKLRKYGNSVTFKTYPDVAHIGIVLAIAEGFHSKAPTLEDVEQFVNSHSK